MTTLNLNLKTIREKTKLGWTLDKISDHFGLDSYEFETSLRKKVGEKKASDVLSEIRKNNKKKNGPKGKFTKRDNRKNKIVESFIEENLFEVPETEVIEAETVESEVVKAEVVEAEVVETEAVETKVSNSPELKFSVQDLEDQVISLTNEILNLEKSRKSCLTEINSRRKEVEKIRDDIKIIEESLLSKKEHIFSLAEEMNVLSAEASIYYDDAKKKTLELDNLKTRIKELQKVTILVLNDGHIQYESGEEIEVSDDSKDLYYRMISNENLENLTVKEIKQLSKVIYFANDLKKNQTEFDILFDSQRLEAIFKDCVML